MSPNSGSGDGTEDTVAAVSLSSTTSPREDRTQQDGGVLPGGREERQEQGANEGKESNGGDDSDDDDDDDDEEDEPKLKYASLTKAQGSIYKNGDAASSFLVTGNKMVIGTHNGHIHILSLPSLKPLRAYKAHSASVSMLSVSPFPAPLPSTASDPASQPQAGLDETSAGLRSGQDSTRGSRKPPTVANSPENLIHIASASIDGNVCVASLSDPKDVLLRNFGRPVSAVALSPEYRADRSYVSGGKAGQLVLTTGGRAGASANANTTGAAAAAAGWLHNIGLGSGSGTDTVLHSGEGAISTVKWSLSGRYIVWVNETGIRFMRTNLHLNSQDHDLAWTRMNNIPRPDNALWAEMAGVWIGRVEWVNEAGLEKSEGVLGLLNSELSHKAGTVSTQQDNSHLIERSSRERVLIGWGGTIWIVDVQHNPSGSTRNPKIGRTGQPSIMTILKTDCTVAGVSQFTSNLILVLAYVAPEPTSIKAVSQSEKPPKRGISKKQSALQPEMRIIDIQTKEEICVADTLKVSRFESLSATDYHLDVLPVVTADAKTTNQRGALDVIGDVGLTIWDAALYSRKLFSSTASIMSSGSTGDSVSDKGISSPATKSIQVSHSALLTRGMKIFIQSPYDCVLASKLGLSDHLAWLCGRAKYEEAWQLLDEHPEAAGAELEASSTDASSTYDRTTAKDNHAQGGLIEFFADDASQTNSTRGRHENSAAEKEKRRIGDKWLQQLISEDDWAKAGQVAGKVLSDTAGWEHWAWTFAKARKFDDFALSLPTSQLRPPLPTTVYEVYLGYYLSSDVVQFAELLDRWSNDLFDVLTLKAAVESELKVLNTKERQPKQDKTTTDWRILTSTLARLYRAEGRMREALRLYIRLKDAEAAMELTSQHHLLNAVIDDIPELVMLRISPELQKRGTIAELEEASLEPMQLLVAETCQGVVRPEMVLRKLRVKKDMQLYQHLYLRLLWTGEALEHSEAATSLGRSRNQLIINPLAAESKALVNDVADEALPLFAEFDRALLFNFMKASQSYTLSKATTICEQRDFVPELVYLLSKEGQTSKALRLIIDKLGDVSQAISFAKEQDDPDLWNDLLNLSMKKPAYIRALLEEVGTSINPIALVRRIPEGLEIFGLRESLVRMIKSYELQDSISEGASRVLKSEVSGVMATLRDGEKRGIAFNVGPPEGSQGLQGGSRFQRQRIDEDKITTSHCCYCGDGLGEHNFEALVSFPCGHIFHLPCLETFSHPPPHPSRPDLLRSPEVKAEAPQLTTFPTLEDASPAADTPPLGPETLDLKLLEGSDQGVGPKVRFAADLKADSRVLAEQGCPLLLHVQETQTFD